MNSFIRVSFLWLTISLSFVLHSVYHLSELFFGIDIKLKEATGAVPVGVHLFRIAVEIVILAMLLWSLYAKKKTYYVISYVLAVVLAILNIVHLGGTVANEMTEYSQLALLAFIVVANIFLVIESNRCWRQLKQNKHHGPDIR